MSPLLAASLANTGRTVEIPAGMALSKGPNSFANLHRVGGQLDPAPAQPGSRASPPDQVSSLSKIAWSPSAADALRPRFEHIGNALPALKAQVVAIKPANAAESLRSRFQLLESRMDRISNHLEQTAAQSNPLELLKLQNDIYRVGEEFELLSKVVEQTTGGVKSLLQTQV